MLVLPLRVDLLRGASAIEQLPLPLLALPGLVSPAVLPLAFWLRRAAARVRLQADLLRSLCCCRPHTRLLLGLPEQLTLFLMLLLRRHAGC